MKPGTGATGVPGLDLAGVLFVLGKGGVGKSIVSEGLASLAARSGRGTLLVRIGETLRLVETRAPGPVPGRHGFDVVDLDPQVAMDEYVFKVVRIRQIAERITRSDIYRKFFAAAPGLPELVLLGRMQAYARETVRGGGLRWSTLVVDCPSSGHGLLMLETPFAAVRAVPIGPFSRLAREIIDWLRADVRLTVVAVPEEMAVVEAIELKQDLHERTGLAPALAVMNRIRQDALSPAARRALVEVEAAPDSPDQRLLDCGARVQRRTRLEQFHLKRLTRGLGLSPRIIPELSNCRPGTVAAFLSGEKA